MELERPARIDTAPAFVRMPLVHPSRARQQSVERRLGDRSSIQEPAAPLSMLMRRPAPRVATTDVDVVTTSRSRAVRQELPMPGRTLVLARPAAAASAVAARQSDAIEREQTARARAEWIAPAPPPINVEALTSQVIQQLDRRLIAYRERMGRV